MEKDQDLSSLTVEQITDLFYNVFINRGPSLTMYGYFYTEDNAKPVLKYMVSAIISPKKGAHFSLEESGTNLKEVIVSVVNGMMGLK